MPKKGRPGSTYGSQIAKIKKRPKDTPKGKGKPKGPQVVQDPLAPQNYGQIQAGAHQAGQVAYGDVQNQLAQQGQNIAPWFDVYKQGVLGQQAAVPQQYAQPIAQAQQTANATGQGVLKDADPNSEAAQNDVLAAASRKAMADMFTNLLTTNQAADETYYGARQNVANAAQISAQTQNAQSQRDVAGQRGAFEQTQIQQGIQSERDYGLGLQHQAAENAAFGLDVQQEQNKVKTDRQKIRATNRKNRQSQRDRDEDQALAGKKFDSQEEKDAYQRKHHLGPYKRPAVTKDGLTPAQQRAEEKRIEGVRTKSKEALSRLDDAKLDWESLVGSKVTTGKKKKDKDGNSVDETRPITPKDIRVELRRRGFSAGEIHLMLMIRAGKKFGPKEVEQAHALGIRIPRKYLPDNPYVEPIKPGNPKRPSGPSGTGQL